MDISNGKKYNLVVYLTNVRKKRPFREATLCKQRLVLIYFHQNLVRIDEVCHLV